VTADALHSPTLVNRRMDFYLAATNKFDIGDQNALTCRFFQPQTGNDTKD